MRTENTHHKIEASVTARDTAASRVLLPWIVLLMDNPDDRLVAGQEEVEPSFLWA